MGKSANSTFLVVSFQQVYENVVWDLLHNTYFCLEKILLRQGPKGVPIGGFLSAQIMVLWVIFSESVLLTSEGMHTHMRKVRIALSQLPVPPCSFSRTTAELS